MSLSPKYNTAFSVTSLLNPALEDAYKISSQFQHHLHHNHSQQDLAAPNFLNSYSSRNNNTINSNNASSSSSSVSSTSSSIINSSTKHPSPSNSANSGTHPSLYQNSPTSQLEPESSRFTSAIQPALGSLCSSGSNSSSSAVSTTTTAVTGSVPPVAGFNPAGLANPYFNYSNNQFSSFHHSGNNFGHQGSAHHHYNAYNQAYGNGNMSQNFTESDSYPNAQLQYSTGGPQSWYPNPSDPRFSSKNF